MVWLRMGRIWRRCWMRFLIAVAGHQRLDIVFAIGYESTGKTRGHGWFTGIQPVSLFRHAVVIGHPEWKKVAIDIGLAVSCANGDISYGNGCGNIEWQVVAITGPFERTILTSLPLTTCSQRRFAGDDTIWNHATDAAFAWYSYGLTAVVELLQRAKRYLGAESKVVAIGVVEAVFGAAHEAFHAILVLKVVAIVIAVIDPLKRWSVPIAY